MCDLEEDRVFLDSLTNEWYLRLATNEWDKYEDDFVYIKEYISYCPYCGRKLE